MFETLNQQVALVTGASRGLGREIALSLSSYGVQVYLNCLPDHTSECETLRALIESQGGTAWVVAGDVADAAAVAEMFECIDARSGRIDILVNNAGTSQSKDIFESTEADWDMVLDTNLKSMFLCSKMAFERMRSQQSGRVVNMGSVVGHVGARYGHCHYAASKSGVFGLSKTLARTGAAFGVNVNCVAPGVIDTPLLQKVHGTQGIQALEQSIPLGLGAARDVAHAVVFLCSDGARYITGETLNVNGGMDFR